MAQFHTAWLGLQPVFSSFLPCGTTVRGFLDGLQWAEGLWVFAFVCKHVGLRAHMCVWFSRDTPPFFLR